MRIEAALNTSVDAPTSPSRRWLLGSPVNISRQWSLHGRLSSPVDVRPSGAAVQDEEQPRSTSPMMRAVQALQRRFTSSTEQRTSRPAPVPPRPPRLPLLSCTWVRARQVRMRHPAYLWRRCTSAARWHRLTRSRRPYLSLHSPRPRRRLYLSLPRSRRSARA